MNSPDNSKPSQSVETGNFETSSSENLDELQLSTERPTWFPPEMLNEWDKNMALMQGAEWPNEVKEFRLKMATKYFQNAASTE